MLEWVQYNIIQKNAIQSWKRCGSVAEIILCGNDPGVAEICDELQLKHIPNIACTSRGTPFY